MSWSSGYFALQTRFELDRAKNSSGIGYAVVKLSIAGRIEDQAQLEAMIEVRKLDANLVRSVNVIALQYDMSPG